MTVDNAKNWQISSRTVLLVGAAAVALKLLLLFVVLPALHAASPTTYQADKFPDWYDFLARTLAEGHGYRFFPDTTETMLRTPGWPLVLAGIFKVFGYGMVAVQVFNVLCSIGTACLTFRLAEHITGMRLLALMAGLIAFLHPAIVIADSRGGVESFFMLALMIFMVLIYRAFASDGFGRFAIAGAALGAVLLIKSTAALFVPCVFFYMIMATPTLPGVRRAILATAVVLLTAGAVLSPWIVRNYALSGRFVPTMSVGGMAAYSGFYIATHSDTGREQHVLDLEASNEMGAIAEGMGLRFKAGYYPQFYAIDDEVAFYTNLGTIVRGKYRQSPSTFLHVLAYNARGFWVQGRTARATTMNMIIVLPFLAVAALGAYFGWRRKLLILPVVLFIGAFFAAHAPILGQARYHVPLIPLLAILFCLAFLPLVEKGRVQ